MYIRQLILERKENQSAKVENIADHGTMHNGPRNFFVLPEGRMERINKGKGDRKKRKR